MDSVDALMNRELYSVHPDDTPEHALSFILALGITGAPVIDEHGKAVGMVAIRDLALPSREGETVRHRMTTELVTTTPEATPHDVARLLGERGLHRLLVVDPEGRALGMISALDLLRYTSGLPASHPSLFSKEHSSHRWSEEIALSKKVVAEVPEDAGVLCLIQGDVRMPERVIWVEACDNVRSHVARLVRHQYELMPHLLSTFEPGSVRFRYALAPELSARMQAIESHLTAAKRAHGGAPLSALAEPGPSHEPPISSASS